MAAPLPSSTRVSEPIRRANVRAAWILATIAVCFFGGIILAQAVGQSAIGFTVLGFAVIAFLGLAIGRNLRQ